MHPVDVTIGDTISRAEPMASMRLSFKWRTSRARVYPSSPRLSCVFCLRVFQPGPSVMRAAARHMDIEGLRRPSVDQNVGLGKQGLHASAGSELARMKIDRAA